MCIEVLLLEGIVFQCISLVYFTYELELGRFLSTGIQFIFFLLVWYLFNFTTLHISHELVLAGFFFRIFVLFLFSLMNFTTFSFFFLSSFLTKDFTTFFFSFSFFLFYELYFFCYSFFLLFSLRTSPPFFCFSSFLFVELNHFCYFYFFCLVSFLSKNFTTFFFRCNRLNGCISRNRIFTDWQSCYLLPKFGSSPEFGVFQEIAQKIAQKILCDFKIGQKRPKKLSNDTKTLKKLPK